MEDGGFEIEIVLDEAPASNVFEFQIEGAEDLDFFYQPPLSDEEIAEGAVRPENVIGSYAVYHKAKANHRVGNTSYSTGRAFHIYRPKAIDANGCCPTSAPGTDRQFSAVHHSVRPDSPDARPGSRS
jgi:hypothetical protein